MGVKSKLFDKIVIFWNENFKFRLGIFLLVTIFFAFKFLEKFE